MIGTWPASFRSSSSHMHSWHFNFLRNNRMYNWFCSTRYSSFLNRVTLWFVMSLTWSQCISQASNALVPCSAGLLISSDARNTARSVLKGTCSIRSHAQTFFVFTHHPIELWNVFLELIFCFRYRRSNRSCGICLRPDFGRQSIILMMRKDISTLLCFYKLLLRL
jgi:hypothetical protein